MGMKASEVGDWLRQIVGKRDHREVLSGDHLVLRPGPNFHWLMGHSAPTEPTEPPPPVPGQNSTSDDRREAGGEANPVP